MKRISIILLGLAAAASFTFAIDAPLHGKIIALDAGHGGGETGATNVIDGMTVIEADVNMAVVNALIPKLEAQGAYVAIADRLPTRRDRVNDSLAKCAALDVDGDGVSDEKKCDVLVSVHHNGNADPDHDGTLVIYNEKKDKPLAEKMLAALRLLTGKSEGLKNGGYGMTVYGNLVSVITEAYYITNDCEAELYLYSSGQRADISQECKDKGFVLENRIDREAEREVWGLTDYFASQTGGRGKK